MTPKEILVAARERVAKGWCKGKYSVDADGNSCCFADAAKVCASGAMMADEEDLGLSDSAIREARGFFLEAIADKRIGNGSIVDFNDDASTTQTDVLAAFDKAIAAAGET